MTLNWGELAEHLDISRAMLDFIRAGHRDPSPKTLRKIEAAEIAVGLRKSQPVQPLEHPPDKTSNDWKVKAPRATHGADDIAARLDRLESLMQEMLEEIRRKKS